MTKVLAPVMFFGTDEARNEGVKDFRPTPMSAVKAEMQEAEKAAEQDGTAGDDESPKESALDSVKSSHPSVQESLVTGATVDSDLVQSQQLITSSQSSPSDHPDLDPFL